MPDRRPLPSLRPGTYDDPPATTETSTPQSRRQRLRNAIRQTDALAQEVVAMSDRIGRRSNVGGLTRRRQRSSSTPDELARATPDTSGEDGRSRRRLKRRRLDDGLPISMPKAIMYGHYGQVEPGKLQMELVSCDGGEHMDHRHPGTSLGPQNVLRHDKSVYCSERPNCTFILKHADDTPFCLEKLHIVGPEMGFTAPVRAGVVYVGMSLFDLQRYIEPPIHARLSGHNREAYRRPRRDRESSRSSPELLSMAEALQDPYINFAHPDYSRPYPDVPARPHAASTENDGYCDIPTPTSREYSLADRVPSLHPGITINSDSDPGPEERSSQETLEYRSQRERSMRRRYNLDGPMPGGFSAYAPSRADLERARDVVDRGTFASFTSFANRRQRREAASDADSGPLDEISATPLPGYGIQGEVEGKPDPNVTSARFGMKAGKNTVAISFSPPVSGRFLLVKVWAGKGNVDVQSVVAKGYMGGMRFFPAVGIK